MQTKDFKNALDDLLPQKLIPVIIKLSGIDETKKVNSITKEERAKLLKNIKSLTLIIDAGIKSLGVDVDRNYIYYGI